MAIASHSAGDLAECLIAWTSEIEGTDRDAAAFVVAETILLIRRALK